MPSSNQSILTDTHIQPTDELDPDFVPTGTAFSLSWSPWVSHGDSRTATLSYIGRNYVGFRRVTVKGMWEKESSPVLNIAASDTTGICMGLSTDAFVKWEDMVCKIDICPRPFLSHPSDPVYL